MNKTLHIFTILLLLFGVGATAYAQGGADPDPAAATKPRVMILGNVYGGGQLAQVIAETAEEAKAQLIQDADLADLFTTHADHVYTTYVHLGSGSEVYGRVFGGGMGQHDSAGESAGRVTGQTDVALDGATVWSEIYGGGEMADVRGNTLLHFKKGKAGHNAFGGGLGKLGKRDSENKLVALNPATDNLPDNRYEPLASADIKKIPANYKFITNEDEDATNLTALKELELNTPANWMAGKITGESFVVFDGTEDSYTHYEFKTARTVNRDANGVPEKIDGLYYTETNQFNPERPEQLFSINHNIYGGGMTASQVEGKTFVHINYGMVNQEMMDFKYHDAKVWSMIYNSIANAQFCVFGGGYGYYTDILGDTNVTMDVQGSGQYKYINEFTKWFANEGKDKYGWDTNTGAPEKIYAAADEATYSHGAPGRSCMDIVGGGYNGKVLGTTHVKVSGDVVLRKVYGGGYYSSVGNTDVQIMSGIYNRVYGGGLIGNVYGTANLTFGQRGGVEVHDANLHLMVKDAIYGGNDVSGTVGTSSATDHEVNGLHYNYYSPVDNGSTGYYGTDQTEYGVRLNIYGGLVLGDVYGAGNGNHPGYSNPDYMEFGFSQHPSENYRQLANAGKKGTKQVYKYRPRTARVEMNIAGNAGSKLDDDPQVDKVRIWGRTFGGGNSCNVGVWDGTADDHAEVYANDATSWHPGDNFTGGGTIQINIGSHVQLGNRNDSHTKPNGLFMGSNGEHLVTQHTDKDSVKYYHHFWDVKNDGYYPGFPVYESNGTTVMPRTAGLKSFKAFINNILTRSDNVRLNITATEDVWMSNFVGGGYRGSMQAATETGSFSYRLPESVTIGHTVVGGSFNAHIIFRVYGTDLENGDYLYDDNGNFKYEVVGTSGVKAKDEVGPGEEYDYIKKLYAEGHEGEDDYMEGFLRYNFDGGILAHDSEMNSSSTGSRIHQVHARDAESTDFITPSTGYNANKSKALVSLDLYNRLDPVIIDEGKPTENVHGGIVYGGCFSSGFVEGDVWVDYRCALSSTTQDVAGSNGKGKYYDKTNIDTYTNADNMTTHRALLVFGAGYGEDTTVDGDVYLRLLHNGTSADTRDYPLIYNAFGGGNMGKVSGNTNVYYNVGKLGTLLGSVYGGGYQGEIGGNTYLEMAGGLAINAYGGSREANIGGAAHVWVYDGIKFPAGEGVAKPESAPLLIGNLYGGNDISGTISGGATASYAGSQWDAIAGTSFNTYVQVASTKADGSRGFPLIGNLFAGGNGLNNDDPATAPDVAKSLLHIVGGNVLRAFGGGNRATVTEDACILVNAQNDVFTSQEFESIQKEIAQVSVFKDIYAGYHWGGADGNTLNIDPYHAVNLFGGNNLAEMRIQPRWNLLDGSLGNVYSGGNMGDMTYYNALGKAATTDGELVTTTIGVENDDGTNANYMPRGLCITIDSPDINIKNLFGGCRLSNVVPGGYTDGTLAQNAAFAGCENLYGATINILQGNIENVYGGNDVGGKVYFGTNINISGGVLGNVYGSGNGDYLYKFDKDATTVTEHYNDEYGFHYSVPEKYGARLVDQAGVEGTDTHKILTINRVRPAVDYTFINIAGLDAANNKGTKRVAAVKGNVFMGGNATTITSDGAHAFTKLKLGSYATINGLFLGSDGHSYAQDEQIAQFARLNGISRMDAATAFKNPSSPDAQHNPNLLNAYLMAVDMQVMPKDIAIKGSSLAETYIGTFCGGGNRGSMLVDKAVELHFPRNLVIYDKVVGGCMNSTINYYQNGTPVQSVGGYTRAVDVANNGGNGNTKIKYYIDSQFKPLVMDATFGNDGRNAHGEVLATAMARGFVYDNLNAGGDAWLTGCNIYGGCYESGIVVGDVELNVSSSLLGHMANNGEDIFKGSVRDGLDDGVTNSNDRTKFDNALAAGAVIGNIYGAGYGHDSDVQGNVRINISAPSISTPETPVHPSANNIYGGGRSGQLHGNTYIRLLDGHVYTDIVGGCDAANMYGSTYVGIGYPTYYRCNTTGKYDLTRGDQGNASNIEQKVYYKEGDFIAPNVYEQITDGEKASKFDAQNEMTGMYDNEWKKTDIIVRGGVYGGGYTLASSTTGMAGDNTVLFERDGGGNKTNYGGNSTILVADRGSLGDDDHIRISTLKAKEVSFTAEQIAAGATTLGLFTLADKKFTQQGSTPPTVGTTYYDLSGTGGIYGDGHLTFCEGFRAADITGYGYNSGTVQHPRLLNTFQRLDLLGVEDCCVMLQGAQDFAADQIDATVYSLTRIDELRMNSSLATDQPLGQISATTGGSGAQVNTAKQRNYIGFYNNVHYLGAIVTNDDFKDASATFHQADGTLGSRSYKAEKTSYISTYTASGKDATATNAFKRRNVGTARNAIGLNNGYCLRVQNLAKDGTTRYYGPIVGVCEVKLLSLTPGEGGGYVYADNIHADESNFLNTSGNFVFPGVDADGDANDQFIVDDCFVKHFGTPDNITQKSGNLDEAHYWYVEGNKYFFNTTLTGYTYQDALNFNLTDNDPNVVLSGMQNGSTLQVKKVEWLSKHRDGYQCKLEKDKNADDKDATNDYEFDIDVNGTSVWTADMPRYTMGDNGNPLTTASTFNSTATPIFNVKLQDKLNNSGDDNYINHLDEPEQVKIYLKGQTNGQDYEYTITLNIVYLQGPTYTGGVQILNCALPGERISFSSDGISIKTPELMPVTDASWQILPFKEIDGDGNWSWDSDHGETFDPSMYEEDLHGGLQGDIRALYSQNYYNIAYTFTAGGKNFPVLPNQDAEFMQNRMIVVHNYHHMKDIEAQNLEASLAAGARVYIEDEADLAAFVRLLNAAVIDNDRHLPVGLTGINVVLQKDITLASDLAKLTQPFAGTFHGDGYRIDLGNHAASLFDSQLTGNVYNLGLLGGTIATTGTRTNCYEYDAATEAFASGAKAYELSHYFTPVNNGYVEQYYANGDYQYATTDRVWSLRNGAPNYGRSTTHHNAEHPHDAARWNEGLGVNVPLHDGTATVDDREETPDDSPESVIYHGFPVGYANDYLFFGQHLDKTNADPYPVHINPTAKGDLALAGSESAARAKGGNRVYETAGYYRSTTDQKFYYNKEALVIQPTLTAIDFTHPTPEGDGTAPLPATFSVDSNLDHSSTYSNATTGHVTQNLLVYNAGEDVFTYRDTKDSQEAEVRYHNIRLRHDPDPSGVHNGDDPLDYSQHRVPDASVHTALPDRVNPEDYVTDYFHLVDKQEFCAPIAFDVDVLAWYERLPQSYRRVSGINASEYDAPPAWEGICLPFTVMTVNGEDPGNIISHFYGDDPGSGVNDHTLHHEYWLTGLVQADGDHATFARPVASPVVGLYHHITQQSGDYIYENTYYRTLPDYLDHFGTRDNDVYGNSHDQPWYSEPHTFKGYVHQTQQLPYLIAFPGDGYYEFDLSASGPIDHDQVITFSAPVTTIPVSAPATTTVDNLNHAGTYLRVTADNTHYVTNTAGNAFVNDHTIYPFRTYMTTSSSSVRRIRINAYEQEDESADINTAEPSMHIYGDGTTLVVESNFETDLRIFSTAGRCVRNVHVVNGTNRYPDFHPDVYIVGGVKVLLVP